MTTLLAIFVAVGCFAFGLWVGWYARGRPESAQGEDPEAELRELRHVHSGCAATIRSLHLELAQLESVLAMAGVDTPRLEGVDLETVTEIDGQVGAARLATLINAMGQRNAGEAVEEHDEPAAFMSILPSDLLDDAVRQSPSNGSVDSDGSHPDWEEDVDRDVRPAEDVVISLPGYEATEPVEIDVARRDDLTQIRGIGPKIESILYDEGITTFRQIAELDDEAVAHLGEILGAFKGRIERDDWIGSARELMTESRVSR